MDTIQDRIELTAYRAFRNPARAIEASRWYQDQAAWIASLADYHGIKRGTVAGVVAALSPLNGWQEQLTYTPRILASCVEFNGLPEELVRLIPGPGLGANKLKAARILLGESPKDVLSGDKVKAFFANLTGDETRVTIDRHALAIAYGPEVEFVTPKRYREAETAFRCAAPLFNVTPAGLQALTWVYWREVKAGRGWEV